MTEFFEQIAPGFRAVYDGEMLASERSAFQQIDVYDHPAFGRTLVLDGLVQTTERDEFIYHEMLGHVPLLMLSEPRRVLIIGGGDGGTLRRVLEHPSIERAVMVEIDERVTELCRKFMPSISGGAFDDERADVRFDDGIAFVRETDERFDAILIDSSEPVGPGEGLFTTEFYTNVARILNAGGLLCAQSGSPYFQQGELHRAYRNISSVFSQARVYLCNVPTYPGTLWSFIVAGEHIVIEEENAGVRARARDLRTRYWTPGIHAGAFGVPRIVEEVVEAGGPPRTWEH